MYKIPVYQPELFGNEKKYVNECLDTNWISSQGKFVKEFETKFSSYIGVEHGVAVANGTLACHLAFMALGIGPGDEVLVPTFTYIASANAIRYTGATPVFVDSCPDTWQMDPEMIRHKITSNTKAIMVVHLYGHPCDMKQIMEIARQHELFVVEDCAEAIGSKYNGKLVGSFGDIAAFSFYGNKTITCGEGGMVTTNDETLYARAVHLKGQGLAKYRQYWHDIIGYNYRMTNIAAAIGVAQLEQVDSFIERKRQVARWYRQYLENIPVEWHQEAEDVLHTYWMFSILVPKATQRELLRQALEQAGIETRPVFYPIHTMPMYAQKYQRYPVAEDIGWRGINLPSWPGLSESEIQYICKTIRDFFGQRA